MAHMMMAGRYLYDSPSRRPVGARLLDAGLARREVAAVWLVTGEPPVEGVWPSGPVALDGPAAALPPALLLDVPVAGVDRVGDLADFAVFLGKGTQIDGK
ncbi:MAG TPA: hypothetical protein VLS93_16545 [Anaeromyxobacteraceae bacterium]|nr:hypothetical protein [Anaeromyxobacteraceae bacterium]